MSQRKQAIDGRAKYQNVTKLEVGQCPRQAARQAIRFYLLTSWSHGDHGYEASGHFEG